MIPTLTYRTLVDIVKNHVKSACTNISNFNGMPACYKAGFSIYLGGSQHYGGGRMSGVTTPVVQVSAGTVDSDMTTFLNRIGVSEDKLDYPIDNANLEKFMVDLLVFTSTKVGFVTAQGGAGASSSKYTIYMNNNGLDYTRTQVINPKPEGSGEECVYSGTEVRTLLDNFLNSVKKSARIYPIKFSFGIW